MVGDDNVVCLDNVIVDNNYSILISMVYFVCQHCGAHLSDKCVEDLYEWEDENSMGWSYICPRCKEENYREVKFSAEL